MSDNTIDAHFVSKSNDFAFLLYKEVVAKQAGKNVVVSPFSISTCLALAAMGAGGKTADEMFSVLQYGSASEKAVVAENFRQVIERLRTGSGNSLKVANKIYVMQNYSVKGSFNEVATKSFASEAEPINFGQNVAAAKTMNGWVEQKTNDLIKDLISPDVLDVDTRMVLINAIHFKGSWTYQFSKELTNDMPFWTTATESVKVPMMNLKKNFNYGMFEDLGFAALELTYSDSDVTMMILLPNERDGLAALEAKLPSLNISDIASKMYSQEVEVFLPKFKIEFSLDLNDALTQLGMGTMFSNSAEFPDLLESNEPLKVSKVVHKAFIEVNEEGTEAAAATGMIMMLRCLPMHPYFTVDHPFVFFLRHKEQHYFMGRMVEVEQQ